VQHLKELLTFRGPCIVIYSSNKSQRDALFLKFIFDKELCYTILPRWSYTIFLSCSYIYMFVLIVWHWWIWHSEDRASWYILILRAKFIFDKELCYTILPRWSYTIFLWCSYIDMFVLLVWHWWIWHSGGRASWYIFIIKANEMHYFSNLFFNKELLYKK
jgi:hypothetical protein